MLNSRYLIYDLNQPPLRNPRTLGNAWYVSDYKIVENADAENTALNEINTANEVTIDKRFAENVNGKKFQKDEIGAVILTEYQPNYLKYSAQASSEQLTVFSEIYYEKGWKAFVDGKEVPHFRVNYILRALVLPAGQHTVEFKFHPASYYTGNKVSFASSLLLILAIAGFAFTEFKKRKNQTN
jgi:uncharacterized membrane protein YfhO